MKKIISLVLAFLMLIGMQTATFAGEVSSEGLSVAGWNGWSVASGSAVTTKVNPLSGDSVDRGDMVKVTNGTASRYFAQWFTGAIELSVDVYGEGTIEFHDANARSAGLVTLADGLVNTVDCSYDAESWNTVKLFVMTGTNNAFKKGWLVNWNHRVAIRVLKPVPAEEVAQMDVKDLSQQVRERMVTALAELRADVAAEKK